MDITTLARERFNGDHKKALRALAFEAYYTCHSLTKLTDEETFSVNQSLTKQELKIFWDAFYEEADKNPTIMQAVVEEHQKLQSLKLTRDEIRNATKNPYKAKLAECLLWFVVCGAVIYGIPALFSVLYQGQIPESILLLVGLLQFAYDVFFTVQLAINVRRCFAYRKIKALVDANIKLFEHYSKKAQENPELLGWRDTE